jgi:hypothetical protein
VTLGLQPLLLFECRLDKQSGLWFFRENKIARLKEKVKCGIQPACHDGMAVFQVQKAKTLKLGCVLVQE